MSKVKIILVSHKPFKIPEGELYIPIHAGRKIAMQKSKDGNITNSDFNWMIEKTIGDDTGDNISDKNRLYSECSALYWVWKNYDKIGNPDYIGLMHYRRHFIFNDKYYQSKNNDNWHKALCYINENLIDENYINNIGLSDENIFAACANYDLIVSKDAELHLIRGQNLRENYKNTIPGAKVEDFDLMVDIVRKYYPQYNEVLDENINGSKKTLYQMFIMKKDLFFEYCSFCFDVLFRVENQTNFENRTTNGKRALGYLAELLLSIFVWEKQKENLKILKLGVTEVEFPYEIEKLKEMKNEKCPSYFSYLGLKIKSLFLKGKDFQENKDQRKIIRNKRKTYKHLKKLELGVK